MNRRKMMGAAIVAVSMMVSSGVSVYAEDDVNATVIWRAFDDQFQSGFRIIMENEEENRHFSYNRDSACTDAYRMWKAECGDGNSTYNRRG